MFNHIIISALRTLGYTGSAQDMAQKYLTARFPAETGGPSDKMVPGIGSDVNVALKAMETDARDGLTPAA